MKNGLTSRQNTFAKHVASGNSATQSAILAGYSKKSARFTASKLLTNTNILQRIEEIFDQAGLSDEALVDRLKTAIDAGIGQKANNSDALKGLKLAFGLKGRLDNKIEIEATQESEIHMKLSAMSEEELADYLDQMNHKTQELVARMKERREKKINGDDTKVAFVAEKVAIEPEPEQSTDMPLQNVQVMKAVGIPTESKPAKQPVIKSNGDDKEANEDSRYQPRVSYPA
jgi:hypothetical protein